MSAGALAANGISLDGGEVRELDGGGEFIAGLVGEAGFVAELGQEFVAADLAGEREGRR